VLHHGFASEHVDANSFDARRCAGKIFLDQRLVRPTVSKIARPDSSAAWRFPIFENVFRSPLSMDFM